MEAARTRRFQRPPVRTVAVLAVLSQVEPASELDRRDGRSSMCGYAAAEFFTIRESTMGFHSAARFGLMPRFNSASPTSRYDSPRRRSLMTSPATSAFGVERPVAGRAILAPRFPGGLDPLFLVVAFARGRPSEVFRAAELELRTRRKGRAALVSSER
jgi:hypothetical protein